MLEKFFTSVSNDILQYGLFVQVLALMLSLYFVPAIRKLALARNVTDAPSARKSHKTKVPLLGGVAVYFSATFAMLVVIYMFPSKIELANFFLLGACSMVLLFVGVLDDIVGLAPLHKLILQLIISILLIHNASLYIENIQGLFGFTEISYIPSLLISVFVYVVFINMLNLIDGIDGLASGLSLIAYLFFSYVAYIDGNFFNMLLSMAGVGCLIPFMYHNMFSVKKIFLGDNGSLVMGLILGFLTLDSVTTTNILDQSLFGGNKIVVLMAVFSYPLVDTLRIFTVRIFRKRNPFSADKNHIHHHLLRLGLSHRKATLVVVLYTFFITSISFIVTGLDINTSFIVLFLVAAFFVCLPSFLIKNENGTISFRKKS